MSRKTTLITAAAVTVVALIAGLAYWLAQPSYDDIVKGCRSALAAQGDREGKGRPAACNEVRADDYDALVLDAALDHLGWTDKDGNFDKQKMIDSLDDEP
ncbi:hypothetical protein SAMN05216532_4003 [Streptomyces sp. 2231.1]|uniref:hypothetical protein n=1 Tax=Streptomyces sp. 2231.1 TaxID=1855347 RepID=UPI00089CB2B3|nr:hypothetical protein [Streptomyces sp. 2231.1]SED26688.1 hypothetical protein SAMN05216532_4003 [Streptomyces sp. 2231.1]